MERSIVIRVPATSANCGPGFDTLGVAATIHNDLKLTLLREPALEISGRGEGVEYIPRDESNLVWRAVRLLLTRVGADRDYPGARIEMKNRVPLSRGLGSSASAIVSGLKAANVLMGNPFNRRELLGLATEIEGHPDNVAPALYGGFTVSMMSGGMPDTFSFMPKLDIRLVVAVPSFPLETKAARSVLPKSVPMKDAIFNVSRAALLITALLRGNLRFLRQSFEDTLHQPYRAHLIPGMEDVFRAAKGAGALGAVISGAGPSLVAYTIERDRQIGRAMADAFLNHGVESRVYCLGIERRGAFIIKPEAFDGI